MKKNLVLMICACCAFGLGCQAQPKPREIYVQLIGDLGKPVPIFDKGDVIHWLGPDGKPMTVTFPKDQSPCTGPQDGKPIKDCTVEEVKGVYTYHCDDCQDPVVPVGKYIHLGAEKARSKNLPYWNPVTVSCGADKQTIVPDQIAYVGNEFNWAPGGHSPATSWKVTLTADVCAGSRVFGSPDTGLTNTCKVLLAGSYTYTVESSVKTDLGTTVCTPDTTASLKIN